MEPPVSPVALEVGVAYVLNTEHVCHECGCIVQVFGVMLAGPFSGPADEFGLENDDAPLLTYLTEIPKTLVTVLTERSFGRFRLDFSHTANESYWMNHCSECDAKIGDWFVTKPGNAFFPTTESEVLKVYGTRVPGPLVFRNPRLSVSSWTTLWLKSQTDSC